MGSVAMQTTTTVEKEKKTIRLDLLAISQGLAHLISLRSELSNIPIKLSIKIPAMNNDGN